MTFERTRIALQESVGNLVHFRNQRKIAIRLIGLLHCLQQNFRQIQAAFVVFLRPFGKQFHRPAKCGNGVGNLSLPEAGLRQMVIRIPVLAVHRKGAAVHDGCFFVMSLLEIGIATIEIPLPDDLRVAAATD